VVLATGRIENHSKARYAKVIELVEGHYETEKVPFGMVYRWCTECVVAECGCGERMIFTCSMTTCAGCDTDYAALLEEWLPTGRTQAEQALRPWHLAKDCEGESLPC
jgi:hypothetical protein